MADPELFCPPEGLQYPTVGLLTARRAAAPRPARGGLRVRGEGSLFSQDQWAPTGEIDRCWSFRGQQRDLRAHRLLPRPGLMKCCLTDNLIPQLDHSYSATLATLQQERNTPETSPQKINRLENRDGQIDSEASAQPILTFPFQNGNVPKWLGIKPDVLSYLMMLH